MYLCRLFLGMNCSYEVNHLFNTSKKAHGEEEVTYSNARIRPVHGTF